jgi:hypothetical protein
MDCWRCLCKGGQHGSDLAGLHGCTDRQVLVALGGICGAGGGLAVYQGGGGRCAVASARCQARLSAARAVLNARVLEARTASAKALAAVQPARTFG